MMFQLLNLIQALIVSCLASYFLVYEIVKVAKDYVRKRMSDKEKYDFEPIYEDLTRWFGVLETLIYVFSFAFGYPEFIAVWLTLKVAGGWGDWKQGGQTPRAKFVIFLVGSGISLLLSSIICVLFGIRISPLYR